jgi:branched-chain amino acid transport system ATP-binding protein
MAPLLDLKGVRSGYGAAPVLRDVNLRVDEGEIVALLGANGAGKTTTMLTICGELALQAGEILFGGVPLRGPLHRRARRGIALVTEERSLFENLSAADNLRLGRGPTRRALELFPELERLLATRAGLLSGGEQQMLKVSRALAARPRLLLVDELSLGLAPLVVDRLPHAIVAASAEGTAVLLVEQHARKALRVAGRGYVLCRGEVDLTGTSGELLERDDDLRRSYLAAERI